MASQEKGKSGRKMLRGPEHTLTGEMRLAEIMIEAEQKHSQSTHNTILIVSLANSRKIRVIFYNSVKDININPQLGSAQIEIKRYTFQHLSLESKKLKHEEFALFKFQLDFTGFGNNVTLYQIFKDKKYKILPDEIVDIHGTTHIVNKHNKPYKVLIDKVFIADKKSLSLYGRRLMHANKDKLTMQDYMGLFRPNIIEIPINFPYSNLVNAIRQNINIFSISARQEEDSYFPDFIKNNFEKYYDFFDKILRPIIAELPYGLKGSETLDINVEKKLLLVIKEVQQVIDAYYRGNILEATLVFNNMFDKIFDAEDNFSINLIGYSELKPGNSFYRARSPKGKHFKKEDLFHVKFNDRHVVSINRYSIPGVPALYLGTDPYICYAELDKPNLEDLNFSRLENEAILKIIRIQDFEEMLARLYESNNKDRVQGNSVVIMHDALSILGYIAAFPIVFASTVRVKITNSSFKPEYIMPQLLLQKVRSNYLIDGIEYPSSKIEGDAIGSIRMLRNYVFPVKTNRKEGFCSELIELFNITEPTSLEIEKANGVNIGIINHYSLLHIINSLEAKPVLPID